MIKKSVIRLMMVGDPDLRLMPIYFERLRMFSKVRKYWKFHLRHMNRIVNRKENKHYLAKGFNRWRRFSVKVKANLPAVPLYNLQNREYENK